MASSIVKATAEKLGALLVDEAKSLYKVRDKIENLQAELEWVECFLRDADTQQHQDRIICKWVSQVQDFAYDGEDIIERYLHGISHHRQDGIWNTIKWFPRILYTCDAWTLHNLGSEIDTLTTNISDLSCRLQRYGIQVTRPTRSQEYNTMVREERRTYSHTEEDVIGLEKAIQDVVDQLLKIDVKVVAISGTGGLGKTTLARKVFKHKVIRDHFNNNCVWIYISKEFDNKTIFQEIFFGLEKDEEARKKNKELPIEVLLTKIHDLLQKQTCLVVLDDMWTEIAWGRLKSAFESILRGSNSSSKILVTTRNQGLLQHVDQSGYLHLLQPLSLDDSWKLLKRKASIGVLRSLDDDQVKREAEMAKLGKEMLKHCNGLPIAVIAVGGILSTKKTISEYEDVRKNISSYLMSGMKQDGTSQILEILELSYNELPFYLKPCFLYLGKFPEDYEISTQKLYHLWEAEGFLALEDEDDQKGVTSYDTGERYLNELVQRSLVQVGRCWTGGSAKTCRVHDVIRDMCLRKCKQVSFLSHVQSTKSGMACVLAPFSTQIRKLRRCALHGEDDTGEGFQFGEMAISLRSLLVFKKKCCPASKIWKSIPLLRVLDLEGVRPFHPLYGFEHLIHLRYLSLRESSFSEPSACLFDLQYLETLDLRFGRWMTLRNTLYKMKRLRHLYLPPSFGVEGGKKLKFPVGGQMETIKNFNPKVCETKELMQMANLRVFSITKGYVFEKAEELKRVLEATMMKKPGQLINNLRIQLHEDVIRTDPDVLNSASHHPNFKELRIKGRQCAVNDRERCKGIVFPINLTQVELNKCETIGGGDFLLGLEKLPLLRVVGLYDSVIVGEGSKMSLSAGSFSQLKEFYIRSPKGLFEWEVKEVALPNLQVLELHKCKNLNRLKNIPNGLTRVVFSNCKITEGEVSALEKLPHLKYLKINGEVGNKLRFSADGFHQLTQLCLTDQTELEEWEVREGALPNLQSLSLKGWCKLKKVNKLPDSLTQVELDNCEMEEGDVSLLAHLEKLPQLQLLSIDNFQTQWGDRRRGNILRFSHGSFPQLRELSVAYLTHLEWEVGDDALPNLLSLTLNHCDKLQKWNRLPDSLTQVVCEYISEEQSDLLLDYLGKLPRLQVLSFDHLEIARKGKLRFYLGSFPQLTTLRLFDASMRELEFGEGSLPNLQQLVLCWCSKLKKLPQGLPESVQIDCSKPCIKGIEKYNTCPHFTESSWLKKNA